MNLAKHRSLEELAAAVGAPQPCAGNMPLDLNDAQFVWFIEEGAVDLFLVEHQDTAKQSALRHLLRAEAGRFLPGIAPRTGGTSLSLMAKGLPGTVLRRLPADSLSEVRDAELARHVDAWIMDVSAALSRDITPRPQRDMLLMSGQTLPAEAGTVSARSGVVWVLGLPPEASLFLGLTDPMESRLGESDAAGVLPLTMASWLTLVEAAPLATRSSDTLAHQGLLLVALNRFHAVAFSLEQLNRHLAVADQANLERERVASRHRDAEHARQQLFNLYGLPTDGDAAAGEASLFRALKAVGRHEGIAFQWPAGADPSDPKFGIRDILDVSGVRGRQVRLAQKERWWVGDNGAMLAFRKSDGRPVALLPGLLGHYREVDPVARRSIRVTAERAASLRPEAWLFYQPLPSGDIGFRDLFRLVRKGLAADFVRFAAAGLLGGLLLLVPAVAVGWIVDKVVPAGDAGLLHAATVSLIAVALLGALLHMLQGMALMRLEGRAAYRVEAAFWDRMLRLPLGFLRRYPSGNLALRGMTFQSLRDAVRAVIAEAVLSIVFLLPAFFLIYLYDAVLGIATAAFGLLSLLVTVLLGLRQAAPHGRVARAVRRLAGRLFQAVNGITKLRIDNAEGTVFAKLAEDYREQKRAELRLGALDEHLKAFGAALPLLAGAGLLLLVALPDRAPLSVGDFLIIYLVFIVFQTAVARLGASFSTVAAIGPAFDQLRPLFAVQPEMDAAGEPVESLDGEIVFDHITFRYDADGPLILDDVTIRANPGEFIAIAGESGAGKSTLFRLALGLEHPTMGAVYYDGRNLRHLNAKQLRRKIGAVPQNVRLHPQDIWDNIAGGFDEVSTEEIWQAAKAGVVECSIRRMPMKLLTNVGVRAGTISGGESQRIMIAQALIRSPCILLLDEATNWLDNESQAEIMANLAHMHMTRVVIAHRLSTLRLADRIYVLQAGKVVQEGSFVGLMGREGVFQDLVRRQMA